MNSLFDPQTIVIGSITSVFGTAYLVYGKKNGHVRMILSGCALLVYPFFVEQLWLAILLGVVLVVVPPLSFRYY